MVLTVTQINAVEITEDTITLKNVHSDFARAYREVTHGSITSEVEEIVREKWGKSSGRLRRKRTIILPTTSIRAGERLLCPCCSSDARHQGRRVPVRPRPPARRRRRTCWYSSRRVHPPTFLPDVPRGEVFAAAGEDLDALRKPGDRGRAIEAAARGPPPSRKNCTVRAALTAFSVSAARPARPSVRRPCAPCRSACPSHGQHDGQRTGASLRRRPATFA